ncbi:MAG: hypothetical protein Q8S18_09015 [Bacteroidales bacterium]|nr:hypothetical protein [Bacteroidales bacterium]
MNTKEIEKLIEKFYNGETSSLEEATLSEWFSQDHIPNHLVSLKPQFVFAKGNKNQHNLNESFDTDLLNKIEQIEKQNRTLYIRRMIVVSLSVAASLIIMIGIYFQFRTTKIEDTFNDPAMAYQEAHKALMFVSDQLNKGLNPLKQGAEHLNTGIEKASEFNKINIIHNYFQME